MLDLANEPTSQPASQPLCFCVSGLETQVFRPWSLSTPVESGTLAENNVIFELIKCRLWNSKLLTLQLRRCIVCLLPNRVDGRGPKRFSRWRSINLLISKPNLWTPKSLDPLWCAVSNAKDVCWWSTVVGGGGGWVLVSTRRKFGLSHLKAGHNLWPIKISDDRKRGQQTKRRKWIIWPASWLSPPESDKSFSRGVHPYKRASLISHFNTKFGPMYSEIFKKSSVMFPRKRL